jgi:hypothetical protein
MQSAVWIHRNDLSKLFVHRRERLDAGRKTRSIRPAIRRAPTTSSTPKATFDLNSDECQVNFDKVRRHLPT